MKILTAAEMAEADARSVAAGVSIEQLMEKAGDAVARFCLRRFAGDGLVVVLCGKGNNGGDGCVAARRMREAGRTVRVALLGRAEDVRGDAARALKAFRESGGELLEIVDEAPLRAALDEAALVVDAVVGTGFKPPLRGLAVVARDLIARSSVPVLAVDLPSGWDADSTAQKAEGAFRADAVVTFVAPKVAHVFGDMTGSVSKPVVVTSIGEAADAVKTDGRLTWTGSSKAVAETPRNVNSNKGRFGHVMVMGGAWGKSGAPSMASLAALRSGAGLVTAAVVPSILPMVAGVTPELMCSPIVEKDGAAARANAEPEALEKLLKGMTVLAVGPGLGTAGETPELVRGLVERVQMPMVLDADALNVLAGHTELLKSAAAGKDADGKPRVLVLTPHPGEMARLLGKTVKDVEADRVNIARSFAAEHRVTLVLKGWRTLVAHPDGRVAVNTSGNPSMAKGGSGDILTGIVAAMLAQFKDDVARAVEAAVFLHGLAGDFAMRDADEHTVLATDTVAHLWRAFRNRVTDEDGFTWVVGTADARC